MIGFVSIGLFIVLIPEGNDGKLDRSAEVFARLYDEYMPKVFHFISYRIEDNSTAEDLTSIVFEKALTRFRTYRSDKAGFSTWLFSIARNTIIDHFRLGHKDRMSVLDDLPEPAYIGTSPEEAVIKSEDFRRLQALLLNLPEPTQRIISLKFGAEMNNRQIAKMLGVSESNVANVLFRAVRMLRDNFKGWQDD